MYLFHSSVIPCHTALDNGMVGDAWLQILDNRDEFCGQAVYRWGK